MSTRVGGESPTNPSKSAADEADRKGAPHRVEIPAVNKKEARQETLEGGYAARVKVHPKSVSGTFRKVKWAVMAVTLAIYYFTPWIRWDRPGDAPDQAVLIDFQAQRFYFFFIEIWPQEFYYITGLLILAAFGLFLVNSLAGRIWCGYACPQTVWVDLFLHVERFIEGDRNAQIRLDKSKWNASKILKRGSKHLTFLLIGLLTGGAWVFYFADAPTLLAELPTGQAPITAYFSVAFFTFSTYLMGGLAREQVCIYMCPWPRIQGAMFDEDSLAVSYREYRGEPRGAHKKNTSWDGRGDCISCRQCVAACPMGIDIRDGFQLECIQCALCIDACDDIMVKVGRPKGLIGYESQANLDRHTAGKKAEPHYIRPRTMVYAGLLVVIAGFMSFTLFNRTTLEVNLIRDRNPVYVTLSDGSVRNGFTLRALNKAHLDRTLNVSIAGLEGAVLMKGATHGAADDLTLLVEPDRPNAAKFYVSLPRDRLKSELKSGASALIFVIEDKATGDVVTEKSSFRGPK